MNKSNEFGKKLKTIRTSRHLSQEELAFQCNMQASHIGQIERGQKNPTLDTLQKISKGLNIPLTELLNFNTEPNLESPNSTIIRINAYLASLSPRQQEHVLAIVKTFKVYG